MKNFCKKEHIIWLIVIIFFNILPTFAVEKLEVKNGDVLSLSECASIAVNNSPMIKKYAYNLQIANSNLGIAKSEYFPTLGINAGVYQEYNSNKNYPNTSSYRELPSADVYLRQLLWNFGKTSSLIKMNHFYKIAAEYQFMDSVCTTIYDIKTKYYNVLKSEGKVDIAKTNVEINKKNVERTKKLSKTDAKKIVDYIDAKVWLTESQMQLTEAENNYNLTMADLGNSMYTASSPNFTIRKLKTFNFNNTYIPDYIKKSDNNIFNTEHNSNIVNVALKTQISKTGITQIKPLPFKHEEAYGLACKNSPDLWVLETTEKAVEQALIYTKREYYPDLTGNVGYSYQNARYYSNHDMNMSVNLTSAVNIKQVKYEIDKAQSNVNLANNDVYSFKQDLYFGVKKCLLNVDKSEKQIEQSQLRAEEALNDLNIVNAKYDKNKTDYIAFQAARKNYIDAQMLYVDQLYDYNISLANLEITMHYHLDNLHEEVEHALHYHYNDLINHLETSMHCEHKHEEESHHHNETDEDDDSL